MKLKVLITAGSVHSYIDPMTVITQRFEGVEMINIALELSKRCDVTFLAGKETISAIKSMRKNRSRAISYITHDGFEDYAAKVLELAPFKDAVILGAKVNDLVPVNPYKEPFPSYKYKKDVVIPIDFYIAPKVIEKVRKVAPSTFLVGYHLSISLLLAEQIMKAAEIMAASDADAVIINDPSKIDASWVVQKDHSGRPISELYSLILAGRQDK